MLLLRCIEGEPFNVAPQLRGRVRLAAGRITKQIRPRFSLLREERASFIISGVIGTTEIAPGVSVEVVPKTETSDQWVTAVHDLLEGSDRIDIADLRLAGMSPRRRNFLNLIASTYAARLEKAFRRDGPLVLLAQKEEVKQSLRGKLRITPWSRHLVWAPQQLPIRFTELGPNNDFARGLAFVAKQLAAVTSFSPVRAKLLSLATALRPGLPEVFHLSTSVASRELPAQWAIYQPAWSIARAILLQRALFGARGPHAGVSLMLEAWPLLERLLGRTLAAAASLAKNVGVDLTVEPKRGHRILRNPQGSAVWPHFVVPDGLVRQGGKIVASFEAKYKRRSAYDWPAREDIYQAISTAAACQSPLAVLIYPETFDAAWWTVEGEAKHPQRLAAIGLGLFSYIRGSGDLTRGRKVLDLIRASAPQLVVNVA